VRHDRSMSFKVIKLVLVESPINFLLVFHCNCIPIFCRFRDITIYSSTICVLRTHPGLAWSPRLGCSPRIGYESWYQKLPVIWCENRTIPRSLVLTHYQSVTDRQTDTPPVAMSRCSVASETKPRLPNTVLGVNLKTL